jgi:DNA invertase Pin-like site-specific DNA recombinase
LIRNDDAHNEKKRAGIEDAEAEGVFMQRPPYGYTVDQGDPNRLIPEPDKIKIVQALFKEIWHLSLRKLEEKYQLTHSTIYDILLHSFYWTGEIKRKNKVIFKVKPVVSKPKWSNDPRKISLAWEGRK